MMTMRVCVNCAGNRIDVVQELARRYNIDVEKTGCLGACKKYRCGRINFVLEDNEYSLETLDELKSLLEKLGGKNDES